MKDFDSSAVLVEHGIRPSRQRRAIMEFLAKNAIHPTAEDVYRALYKKIRTLSRTTVYNTLRLFCAQGVAQMVTLEENEMRFDALTEPHGHFKCTGCGKIFDFQSTALQEALKEVPAGFVVKEAQFYIRGTCKNCADAQLSLF